MHIKEYKSIKISSTHNKCNKDFFFQKKMKIIVNDETCTIILIQKRLNKPIRLLKTLILFFFSINKLTVMKY